MKPQQFIITMACLILAGLIMLGIGSEIGCMIFGLIALGILLAQVGSGAYAAGVREELKEEIKEAKASNNQLTDAQCRAIRGMLADSLPVYRNEFKRLNSLFIHEIKNWESPFFQNVAQHHQFYEFIEQYFEKLKEELPTTEDIKSWQP